MARIPGAENESWAVVCLYTIDDTASRVQCSSFITLPKPVDFDG